MPLSDKTTSHGATAASLFDNGQTKVVDGWFLFSSCRPESMAQLDEPSLDIFRGSRSNKGPTMFYRWTVNRNSLGPFACDAFQQVDNIAVTLSCQAS